MKNKTDKAEKVFLESIDHMDEESVKEAARQADKKLKDLKESGVPTLIQDIWRDIVTMIFMSKDYYSGKYRDVPLKSILSITAALLYFASPFDILPDFIPLSGFIDDAAVLSLCIKLIKEDLSSYIEWRKESRKKENKPVYDD
ncbi:MAG: DUF1232 domain-containing protein [Candidatus Delongbacteria bacterium]|nr:DUF1232 domain-containing protein [Candidatus Delongbacteria bacterium]MBN2836764.1 DUF1232 domain-containing protein [Candidatus Delongbacteria bacterium]